jgi:TetR/AcrR family transcriptional repressor of mexJK operon
LTRSWDPQGTQVSTRCWTAPGRIFLRDGFDGASVDDIARAAGVSKATLYSYFPDKQLLFTGDRATASAVYQTEAAEAAMEGYSGPGRGAADLCRRTHRRFPAVGLRPATCSASWWPRASRFPDLARAVLSHFGPGLIHDRLVHHMRCYVADMGALRIDDFDLAADQFAQLCKAHDPRKADLRPGRRDHPRGRAQVGRGRGRDVHGALWGASGGLTVRP